MTESTTDLAAWLLVALIFAFAGLVHGTVGIGFPMLSTPMLAAVWDVRTAVIITLVPTVAVNLISILYGGQWRESIGRHWPLAFFVPVGCAIGSLLLIQFDPSPFRLFLAAIILLYLNQHRIPVGHLGWITTRPWTAYVIFGTAAGVSAGAVNVMVPILLIFALESGLGSTSMIQLFNLCFLAGKLTQMAVFGTAHDFGTDTIMATLPYAGVAAVAVGVGLLLRKRIDADSYRRWLRRLLALMAGVLVLQFGGSLGT